MAVKCPKCDTKNPSDSKYCKECATPLPPSEEAPVSHTKTMETPAEELTTGSTFAGRYQIIEELGKGGMGKVYRVIDKKINEEVALKLIKPDIASDQKTIERFYNELKLARKISHRNVGRMFDLNEERGKHYITMEYVPGEDLKSFIRRVGQLPTGKAINIGQQVCEGLSEAHRLGVVHRDLKPSNIMIDKEGNAKIMDFGIARSLRAKGITGGGVMIGTPEYMSPEQVEAKEVDQRSDIYSLGVILFEMLTGQLPFTGDTALSIAMKHKGEAPQDPRKLNPQIPENLSRAILKCMEKDTEKRCQSAGELFSELSNIEDEISTAKRVFPGKKTKVAISKKRQQLFWVPVVILFAVLIAVVGYLFLGRALQPDGMKWKSSVAVLPFEDQSLQKDQEPFCEEMTIDVIKKLSSIEGLKVAPYHTMRRYKNSTKSNKEIGKELDVKTILVPYFKKEEDRVRVVAELVNSDEGYVIRSFEYEEESDNIYEVQDRLSKATAEVLGVSLEEEKLIAIKKGETKNSKAYEFYAKGRHFERKYNESSNQSDFESSENNFENALEIDENYPLPYWGLGLLYNDRFVKEGSIKDLNLMQQSVIKAYQINPDLAEANVGLGWVDFYKENLDSAYRYFKRALEISPNDAEINSHVAAFLRDLNLNQKALEIFSRAIELDPVSTFYRMISATCYNNNGEFQKAAALLKEALELEPDDVSLRLYYARQLIMMKKYTEAEEEVARAEKINSENPSIQYTRVWISAIKGEKGKVLDFIEKIEDHIYFTYLLSNVYSILGMKDEAIKNIEEAIEKGFYEVKTYFYPHSYLVKNHFYDCLRDDYRFKEIVKKQKKAYIKRLKKYGDL